MKLELACILIPVIALLNGCKSNVHAIVDTAYINDAAAYEKDKAHCQKLALSYDLTDEQLAKAGMYGIGAGGTGTAAALALGAGAINPVAIPLIVGAGLLGAAGGAMSTDERKARENIMYQCLTKHGYTSYNPHSTQLYESSPQPISNNNKKNDSKTDPNNKDPDNNKYIYSLDIAKKSCADLGFKIGNKDFGNCVMQLMGN